MGIALAHMSTSSSAVGVGTTMAMISMTNYSEQADISPTPEQTAQLAMAEEAPPNMPMREMTTPVTINFPEHVTTHNIKLEKIGAGMGGSVPAPPSTTAHEPEAPDPEVGGDEDNYLNHAQFDKMEQVATEPVRRTRYASVDGASGALNSLPNSPRPEDRDGEEGPLSAISVRDLVAEDNVESASPPVTPLKKEEDGEQTDLVQSDAETTL